MFGVLLCCGRLCEGLLCMGGHIWRVGVAMCRFCGLDKVCTRGWDMLVGRRRYLVVSYVLGVSEF